jgi:sugar-specific transcriptional regulator TrmB
MDLHKLTSIGLNPQQAEVYAFLIKHGEQRPSQLSKEMKLSRTNAYKILDSMVALGIVDKSTRGPTLTYAAANPLSLATLTAKFRAEAVVREEAVNNIMHELLAAFSTHTKKPGVEVVSGRDQVAAAYRKQINLKEDIFFIRTRNDIPMMGYDVMHEIRTTPVRHGLKRQAIMQATEDKNVNYASHKRSNLEITWLDAKSYNEPVEWSATKTSLLIASYVSEPQAVLIIDPIIAAAFLQIFKLLQHYLSKESVHQELDALNPKDS